MKEITKTSRLAGQLEKLFAMLNHDFFHDELETPILTIQSTMRAYGHYTLYYDNGENGQQETTPQMYNFISFTY